MPACFTEANPAGHAARLAAARQARRRSIEGIRPTPNRVRLSATIGDRSWYSSRLRTPDDQGSVFAASMKEPL